MKIRWMRIAVVFVLLPSMILPLAGCWDNRELDTLSIVTGVGLDEAKEKEKMDITLQIGKVKSNGSDKKSGKQQESSVIIMNTTCDSIMDGLIELNRNSSRTMLLQHNQVILFGKKLAEQGIKGRMDLFMRDVETRMEVFLAVADGRADEILSSEMDQETNSGMYISRVMQDQYSMSQYLRVRMLDFTSRMLCDTDSLVLPIISSTDKDDKKELKIDGMAVFKDGKMIGRLDNDETIGYIWTMGKVKDCALETEDDQGKAVFHMQELNSKKNINIRPDGGLKISITVNTILGITELKGFDQMEPNDMINHLTELAEQTITDRIKDTFELTRSMDADIYEFGLSTYRKHPREFEEMDMKNKWDDIYRNIELDVKTTVYLPTTGQIVKTLEMEKSD